MYLLQIDHRVYAFDPTDPTRTPFTLVSAMRAAYGCANAHVMRDDADMTDVVRHAGRVYSDLEHTPTGTRVQRRAARMRRGGYAPRPASMSDLYGRAALEVAARPDASDPFAVFYANH